MGVQLTGCAALKLIAFSSSASLTSFSFGDHLLMMYNNVFCDQLMRSYSVKGYLPLPGKSFDVLIKSERGWLVQ